MRLKHENGPDACPLCEEKLEGAHPFIADWFRKQVKPQFRDAHVSWAFRGEADQNRMVAEKRSKAPWPKSKHNFTVDGGPCAKAIDLFRLVEGRADWSNGWFNAVAAKTRDPGIRWGGDFKSFKDRPHFEMLD